LRDNHYLVLTSINGELAVSAHRLSP
jgi:hypothetical protein